MRLAVISDVHANRIALDAVLEDMPPVDRTVCAGDVVGYNPWPSECVDRVRELHAETIAGNHDRAVAGDTTFGFNSLAGAGVRYAKRHLSDAQIEWLRDLPTERRTANGRVHLVHGHPRDPDRYTRPGEFSPRLLDQVEGEGDESDGAPDVLVLGHTHVQSHEVYEEGIVLNPGSVGQPRDGDPRAAYAIVDLDAMTVEQRRVDYDVEAVVDAVRETDLPERIGTRLREGR